MLGIFADLIASVTTILLPAYLSYKSIRSGDPGQTTPWLIYFIMLSLALLFESWTVFILGWVPFYSWFRLLFLLYLVLPQTQGAKMLYLTYLEPYIIDHETRIDQFIGDAHYRLEKMGLGYLSFIVDWLREKVLGQASPQQSSAQGRPGAGAGPGGYGAQAANYATDLLSRFAMPQARTQAAASGGLGALFSAALSGQAGGATRSISDSHAPTSSMIPDLASLQSYLSNPQSSTADKTALIQSNRDKLTSLLRALDKEQQTLDLAYGSTSTAVPKSRSQQSFEQVSYDELRSAPGGLSGIGYGSQEPGSRHTSGRSDRTLPSSRRTASGGWTSGWFAGGAETEVSRDRDYDDYDRRDREQDRSRKDRDRDHYRDRSHDRDGDDLVSRGWSAAREMTDAVLSSKNGSHGDVRRRG